MMEACLWNCMFAAKNLKVKSVAIPTISVEKPIPKRHMLPPNIKEEDLHDSKKVTIENLAPIMLRALIAWAELPPGFDDCNSREETGNINEIKICVEGSSQGLAYGGGLESNFNRFKEELVKF